MKKEGLRAWPADLQLTDEMKAFAYMKGIDPMAEYEAWEDDCKAHGRKYIDWTAAWRTRVRNAVKFNPSPRGEMDGGLARRSIGEVINGQNNRLFGADSQSDRNRGSDNKSGALNGKPSHLVDDSSSGVPDPELTLEQRRENIRKFKEMVANIAGKKVS